MKAILQRVKFAKVEVGGETVGEIGQGFLVLLGVAKEDDKKEAEVLSNKIAGLRVFTDENDKMNLSLDAARCSLSQTSHSARTVPTAGVRAL